ncbi:Uncharacterised protein [uncultured archaeon]|nr:Uncharacterised protein [uncultured archaeon]
MIIIVFPLLSITPVVFGPVMSIYAKAKNKMIETLMRQTDAHRIYSGVVDAKNGTKIIDIPPTIPCH